MSQFCPEAVIFDMDGLLVDSEPVWVKIEHEMITARGRVVDPAITAKYIGMRLLEFWEGMRADYGFSEPEEALMHEAIAQMVSLVAKHVKPMPGADALLAHIHAAKIPCAIATGSFAPVMNAVVESRGWGDYFAVKVSGDQVERGKPDPQTYLLAAQRLGVAPSACLALEDSPTGARAAVAAGMVCYAVPDRSHAKPERFAAITPNVVESLHEVLAMVKACF